MSTVYEKDYDYKPAAGKYHLIISQSCPFAQRADIAHALLGLDQVISKSVVNPIKTDKIWDFSNHEKGKDEVLDIEYVSEVYKNTDKNYDGPFSVPVLADIESKTVVNQESLDIVKDFATRFEAFHKEGAPKLYLESDRKAIDQWTQKIGSALMAAPYQADSAESQEEYDQAIDLFYETLKAIDEELAEHEYLVGDYLTMADIILYTPLVRFDPLYYPALGVNKYRLQDFPHLWAHLKKLHRIPAFNQSTNFDAIKKGSYLGKNGRERFGREVILAGPSLDHWHE